MHTAAARAWLATAAAAAAVVASAGVAVAPPAVGAAPLDEPLAYCDGSLDAGATGAYTDAEHGIRLPEAPLPAGVSERRLVVDGVATRVLQSGPESADEAVVFVHGNPDSARDWDALLARTGYFGRAVAFDMPGYGRADDRRGLDYSTTGAARFIGRVLEELGVRRVHLVLHDFGGTWGLEWATSHLAALRSVTLLDGGALIGFFGHPTGLVFSTPAAGEAFMAVTNRAGFKTLIGAQNPLPERFLDRLYDDYDRATRCAILHYYRSVQDGDALGRRQAAMLRGADVPALVVWGARDPYLPASIAGRQTQAFPRARVAILPDVGHWPHVEAPERTESLVTGFLKDVGVRLPRLVAAPQHARRGARRLSVRVSVEGAPAMGGARLVLRRGGRVVGATRARSVDGVARRIAIALRHPLRRGAYVLELRCAELPAQTRTIRVR